MFYKIGFLRNRRNHIKTPEIYNSNEKRLQCRCFPMIFAKHSRAPCYRKPSDDCFWIFSFNCFLTPTELIETRFFLFLNVFIVALERDKYHHELCSWKTLLCETNDPLVAAWEHTFLWDTTYRIYSTERLFEGGALSRGYSLNISKRHQNLSL